MSHSPGPWKIEEPQHTGGWGLCVSSITNFIVARIPGRNTAERRANVALIAAAPELLAACEAAFSLPYVRMIGDAYEEGMPERALYEQLRNAIAKARGKGVLFGS